ncbi:putative uncharacterized protein DDB_G0282133 [Zerene cesonia]|uniref:putative uncharacterized protein DDB_G0282133 n=1 Tax=Zerene cesonia TaxID=33412 RepID=UPI0018E5207F|nr:putative uncharacterized protein DDB_G0282133 [Zerene cesonia]
MRRSIILFYLLSGAYTQMKTYQHQIFMARKTRSNAPPMQTGYSYSRVNDGPGLISVFNNNIGNESATQITNKSQHGDAAISNEEDKNNRTNKFIKTDNVTSERSLVNKETKIKTTSDHHVENHTERLEAKPTTLNEFIMNYNGNTDYRVDDDDLRKDSNMYDGWPYFHRSPYDYEYIKYDNESDKAKDKRFIYDIIDRVIPVKEVINNDIPPPYYNPATESKENEPEYPSNNNYDNPMYGNQPFFSSVLSDYFDSNYEEDPLTFKGLNWIKDFDNKRTYSDIDDSNKRVRRLQIDEPKHESPTNKYYIDYNSDENSAVADTGFNKYSNREDESLREKIKDDNKKRHRYNGDSYRGFKDFVDSFANKFGSEGHNKDTNYKVNRTQDKGEKKKGFRRVYHKDEYQEDNEFYDNTNNKTSLTESGGSKYNIGGSEAILGSRAAAAINNEGNALTQIGNKDTQSDLKRNKDRYNTNGHDFNFHHYKDIARMAAIQNNADYFDPFLN